MPEILCNLCLNLGGRSFDFSKRPSQIRKAHAETHRFQVGDSSKSSLRYFQLCFFPMTKRISRDPKVSEGTSVEAGRSESQPKVNENAHIELRAYCYALVKKCTTEKIKCSECGAQVKIYEPDGSRRTNLICEHAVRHMEMQRFACSYCDFQTATKAKVKLHIKVRHVKPMRYVDRTDELKDEIMATIGRCFGSSRPKTKWTSQSPTKCSVMKTIRTRPRVRSNNPPAIYLHCVKLAKKFSKYGFIICRKCSRSVSVEPFMGGVNMVHHVIAAHSMQPVFFCPHCTKSFYIYLHVKYQLHGLHLCSATGSYVDKRKKYESDVVDMLSRCFASETTKKEEEIDQDDEIVQLKAFGCGNAVSKDAIESKGTRSPGPSSDVEGGRHRFSSDHDHDYATNHPKLIDNHK